MERSFMLSESIYHTKIHSAVFIFLRRKFAIAAQSLFLLLFFSTHLNAQPNFWQPTNGPNAGIIHKIVIDSLSNIYAATENGIFRSPDNGNSWTALNNGLTNLNVHSFTIAPGGTFLAGTWGDGIFRSTNSGASWNQSSLDTGHINGIAASTSSIIFACVPGYHWSQYILKSVDNGSTWSWSYERIASIREFLFFDRHPNGTVYFGTPWYLFWKTANETDWRGQLTNVTPYAMTQLSRGHFYVGGDYYNSSGTARAERRTQSQWWNWTTGTSGLPSSRILSMYVDSVGRVFAGTADSGVYESVNHCNYWTPLTSGMGLLGVRALAADSNTLLYAGADDGIVYRSVGSTIMAIPPLPVSPMDQTGYYTPDSTMFLWKSAALALSYRIQVSTDSTFTSGIFIDTLVADTSLLGTTLPEVDSVYWRVQTQSTIGNSEFSRFWRFITGPPPPPPVLVSPPDSARDMPLSSITFVWRKAPTAKTYQLYFHDLSWETSDTSLTIPPNVVLNRGGWYPWKVLARNIASYGEYSTPWLLRTVDYPPYAPSLVYPTNNTYYIPTTINFVWRKRSTAATYTLQIATDTLFTNIVVNDSSITDTSKEIQGLAYSTTYFWRVRGSNAGGAGEFGSRYKFVTNMAPPDRAPTLLSWQNNVDGEFVKTIFVWGGIPQIWSYTFEIAFDSLFTELLSSVIIADTVFIVNLNPETQFYCRLSAQNQGGSSGWSQIYRVKITADGVIEQSGTTLPTEYRLYRNYPNPFNNQTNFRFDVPELSKVILSIYSIAGTELERIQDDEIPAGRYTVSWNADRYASGIYIVRMTTENYVSAQKVVLLK
ncbi:MAG: T9SS type A sorting domain-containing protein [Bacteroidetes bacterium]|nr:MAG: T9SS type A sorting domain-containing protein [Bacteroidota bacterium]